MKVKMMCVVFFFFSVSEREVVSVHGVHDARASF